MALQCMYLTLLLYRFFDLLFQCFDSLSLTPHDLPVLPALLAAKGNHNTLTSEVKKRAKVKGLGVEPPLLDTYLTPGSLQNLPDLDLPLTSAGAFSKSGLWPEAIFYTTPAD